MLSNEYQHGRGLDVFQKSLRSCALDESSLSIGKVKYISVGKIAYDITVYSCCLVEAVAGER